MSRRREQEWSRTSPKNKRRGCLCKDGNTYSRDCCKGAMINQGIGNLTGQSDRSDVLLQEDGSFLLQENQSNIKI